MKLIELRKAVSMLVFENDVESEEAFYYAVNRAIMRARMSFPKVSTYSIGQTVVTNVLGEGTFKTYECNGDMEFEISDARGYSFMAKGVGKCVISWYNVSTVNKGWEDIMVVDFNSLHNFTVYKGVIKRFGQLVNGRFKLTFTSDFNYTLKNVAMYDMIKSFDDEDVQTYSDTISYDIKKLTSEYIAVNGIMCVNEVFVGLDKAPYVIIDSMRCPVDFAINDGILKLPRYIEGDVHIDYVKTPSTVGTSSNDNDEIDVPQNLAHVLAYLVASNLLIEEDIDRSRYYMAMWNEAEERALNSHKSNGQVYINVNNWG